jgi:predicted metal-binding membrane protein
MKEAIRRHPEWSATALVVAAWLEVSGVVGPPFTSDPAAPMPHMAVTSLPMHSMPGMSTPMVGVGAGRSVVQSGLGWAVGWLAMATAMMVPAALPAVRALALTVSPRRRQRTIALFVSSYLIVWLLFGMVAVAFVALLRDALAVGVTTIAATALVAAATWELTPWRRRSLRACQTVTLLSAGRHVSRACARAGLRHGALCAVGCWAVMLAMAASMSIGLLWMSLLAVLMLVEHATASWRQPGLPVAIALLGCACASVIW